MGLSHPVDRLSIICDMTHSLICDMTHSHTHTHNEKGASLDSLLEGVLHCVAVCCSVLQCAAVCCSVL